MTRWTSKHKSAIQLSGILSLICFILLNLYTIHYTINENEIHRDTRRVGQQQKNNLVNVAKLDVIKIKQPEVVPTDWTKNEDLKFPRIVHLTWKDDHIPEDTVKWVKRWPATNPNYQVWFWTDASAKKFITTKFPHLLDVYNRYRTGIFKADAMRYIILYEYGGVWADLDVEPLKSLDPVRDKYPSILSQESEVHARSGWHTPMMICNAFMATRKHHPFFKFLIEMLEINQKDPHPVAATGPMMITRMHKAYEPLYEALGPDKPWNKVHIASINMFMPTTDSLALENLERRCKEKHKKENAMIIDLCDKFLGPNFKNGPTNESYTDHHWWHSWFGKQNHRTYHNIATALPNVIFPDKHGKF